MNKDIVGKRIKIARELTKESGRKVTQKDLAAFLEVDIQSIKNWENSRNIPNVATLEKISQFLNISYLWLIGQDAETIINESKNILTNNSWISEKRLSIKEEAKAKCILEALTMCGYRFDEIHDTDNFFEFMESSMVSLKNSIELYMKTMNRKEGE